MHHLAAFYSAVPDASTYANLAAVADQSLPVDSNGNFLPQSDWRVWYTALLSNGSTAARHRSPRLQELFLPEIYPFITGTTVPDNVKVVDYQKSGPSLRKNDPYNVQTSQASGGALDTFCGVWLGDRLLPAPGGPVNRIPFTTASTTLAKGTWVNAAITTTQQLPSGRYAIVGMAAICTALFLARLVFPGQNAFRPGCIAQPTKGFYPSDDYFGNGRAGLYGYFDNTAPPSVDLLGIAAGAQTATVYLDLVKVG